MTGIKNLGHESPQISSKVGEKPTNGPYFLTENTDQELSLGHESPQISSKVGEKPTNGPYFLAENTDQELSLGHESPQISSKVGEKPTNGSTNIKEKHPLCNYWFIKSTKSKPVYQEWHAKSMTESSSKSEEKGDVSWSKKTKELQLSNESEFDPLLAIIVKELIKLCLSTQKNSLSPYDPDQMIKIETKISIAAYCC